MRTRMVSAGLFLACLALSVTGCGPSYGKPVTVKGKVTVSGSVASDANIIFQAKEKLPADKRTAQSKLNSDGTYQIENVYPAEYDVFLQSVAPVNLDMNSALPPTVLPVNEDGTPISKPAKVPTGNNEFNFDF